MPQNETGIKEKMEIMRPYTKSGYTEDDLPSFYQPPSWRWVRDMRKNQNSKGYEEIPVDERGLQKYSNEPKSVREKKKNF
jgi:hypothetical protein